MSEIANDLIEQFMKTIIEESEPEKPIRTPCASSIFGSLKTEENEHSHPLEIRPIKTAAKLIELKDKHENLLLPPFLYVINGGVRSGKSCLITNLIYRKEFYRDVFNKIFLISPTAYADPTFSAFLKDPKAEVHAPTCSEDLNASIKHIMNEIAPENQPTGEKYIIVIDDCAGFINNGDALCALIVKYRHYNACLCISTQYYLKIPPVIRTNATAIIIFKIANSKEKKTILEEQASTFGDEIEKYYNIVFNSSENEKNKYNFIILDLRNRQILKNWSSVLWCWNKT